MKIRTSIFGSGSEKELYDTITSNWLHGFKIYPSLPLTAIIDFFDNTGLTEQEKDFLKKTNVDYTVCTQKGQPLLSIEFDGMGHGFSNIDEYIQLAPTDDPNRKLKLKLKLKVATQADYPFFIVSYDEKNLLRDENLTIVDGIIGSVLAKKHFLKRIYEMYNESKDEIQNMMPWEEQEFVQDLVLQAEVEADMTWNPIVKKASEYDMQIKYKSMSIKWLDEPGVPDVKDMFDLEGIKKRAEALKKATRIGCEIVVETPQGKVSEKVWIRNIKGWGFNSISLVKEIAELFAFKKALQFSNKGENF